jgi:hypothetical protein
LLPYCSLLRLLVAYSSLCFGRFTSRAKSTTPNIAQQYDDQNRRLASEISKSNHAKEKAERKAADRSRTYDMQSKELTDCQLLLDESEHLLRYIAHVKHSAEGDDDYEQWFDDREAGRVPRDETYPQYLVRQHFEKSKRT